MLMLQVSSDGRFGLVSSPFCSFWLQVLIGSSNATREKAQVSGFAQLLVYYLYFPDQLCH
jgi:hypothetical protein